jgi:small subunit ribosomal protein S13
VDDKSKPEKKDKSTKTKEEKHPDDFKFIVRLSNTDVHGDKTLINGLTSIKGIGRHLSSIIIDNSGLDRNLRVGKLTDDQITLLQDTIDKIAEISPSWMLNHQKDFETGEDIHLIGPEIDLKLRDEINMMRKIRCYRGIRHEQGLSVRGQRTRSNKRTGLTLGVSKSR